MPLRAPACAGAVGRVPIPAKRMPQRGAAHGPAAPCHSRSSVYYVFDAHCVQGAAPGRRQAVRRTAAIRCCLQRPRPHQQTCRPRSRSSHRMSSCMVARMQSTHTPPPCAIVSRPKMSLHTRTQCHTSNQPSTQWGTDETQCHRHRGTHTRGLAERRTASRTCRKTTCAVLTCPRLVRPPALAAPVHSARRASAACAP